MIVKRKRNSTREIPRKIVRRTRPAVGEQRAVVRRTRSSSAGSPPRSRGVLTALRRMRGPWLAGAAVALMVVAMAGASAYLLYESPFFEIASIEVQGNSEVSTRAIVERADLIGERMFNADLAEAQRSIYAIPVLSSVRLERKWPNTVVVHVEERQPWGAWEQGGVTYTIDREGVVIGTAPPAGLPVIVSSEIGSRQLGDRVDYQAVDAAADIYELLPQRLGTTVTEVAFLTGKGVRVTTGNGQVALLGDSSGINYKLSVWEAVSERARAEGIEYSVIDLRYGNRPVLQ